MSGAHTDGLDADGPDRLRTHRLTLRQLTPGDLPTLVRELGRWEVVQWLARVPHPYGMADAEWWLDHCTRRHGPGDHLFYAVVPQGRSELVGGIGLDFTMHADGAPDLGYWLSDSVWGRGYGTEMARAVIAAGFRFSSIEAIQASPEVANQASNRVLQKAGMRPVGRVEQASRGLRGGTAPANLYRITRQEFEATHERV